MKSASRHNVEHIDFSVVIPAYNRASLINYTLTSILDQTHPAAEIIVVDDGSTDDTAEVVERYCPRVRLIRAANGGAPAARNLGARASTAGWLAFCDSDDLWRPDHLQRLAALFVSGVPYACSNFVHVVADNWGDKTKFDSDPTGFWRRPGRMIEDGTAIADSPLFPHVLSFQAIFASCIAMTREFYYKVGGYDPTLGRVQSEDLDFTLRCAACAPTGIVLKPTVGIRKHAGNHSADMIRQLCGEIEILRRRLKYQDVPTSWHDMIIQEVWKRSIQAVDASFAAGRLDVVRELGPTLPDTMVTGKLRVKRAIAKLPEPVAKALCSLLAGDTKKR